MPGAEPFHKHVMPARGRRRLKHPEGPRARRKPPDPRGMPQAHRPAGVNRHMRRVLHHKDANIGLRKPLRPVIRRGFHPWRRPFDLGWPRRTRRRGHLTPRPNGQRHSQQHPPAAKRKELCTAQQHSRQHSELYSLNEPKNAPQTRTSARNAPPPYLTGHRTVCQTDAPLKRHGTRKKIVTSLPDRRENVNSARKKRPKNNVDSSFRNPGLIRG